jgi:alkylhydroperoxidase family enzyme
MKPRIEVAKLNPKVVQSLYCIDMHAKDARAAGETEQRLYGLDAWREAPYYSERARHWPGPKP